MNFNFYVCFFMNRISLIMYRLILYAKKPNSHIKYSCAVYYKE